MLMKNGLIINSISYQDKNKIIYILSEDCKDSLIVSNAKTINKSNVNISQNLTLITYEKYGKNSLAKAKTLEALDYYFEVKNDIKKMAVASYLLEIIYRFINETSNIKLLYKMVISFLDNLKTRNDYSLLLLEFKIKMLYFLGINPSFNECIFCGRKDNLIGLSLKIGGMECFLHKSEDNIGSEATKIIQHLYLDKDFSLRIDDDNAIKIINDYVETYYENHFSEVLKSNDLLKKLGII